MHSARVITLEGPGEAVGSPAGEGGHSLPAGSNRVIPGSNWARGPQNKAPQAKVGCGGLSMVGSQGLRAQAAKLGMWGRGLCSSNNEDTLCGP